MLIELKGARLSLKTTDQREQKGMTLTDDLGTEGDGAQTEPTREEERGDVAEPDAPTTEEENDGMSTILDANPVTGVQNDASDE